MRKPVTKWSKEFKLSNLSSLQGNADFRHRNFNSLTNQLQQRWAGNHQYDGWRFRVLKFFNEWNLKSAEYGHQQNIDVPTDNWVVKRLINQDQYDQACDCLSLLLYIPEIRPSSALNNQFQTNSSIRNQDKIKCPWECLWWGRNKKILQSMEATWSMCRI